MGNDKQPTVFMLTIGNLAIAMGLTKKGQKIIVNSEHRSEEGLFCGLDIDGALLLRQGEHIKKIYAGDIFIKKDNTKNG